MNKVGFAAGIIVVVGGAYGANTYLINKAAQQVPVQTEKMIAQAHKQNMQVELLNSNIDGKHITQEFALYILDNDGVPSDKPLYMNHTADIGWFGLNIDGRITLPKDKGLAKDIVEDLTPFTENIVYTFALATQEVDLNSSFNLEPVTFEPSKGGYTGSFEVSTIHFSMQGSEENNSGKFKIDNMRFHKDDTDVVNSKFGFNNAVLNFSNNNEQRTSNLSIDTLDFSEKGVYADESYHLQGITLISDLKLQEKIANIETNFSVDAMDVKYPGLDLTDMKTGFSSKIDGIDISKVEDINEAIAEQDEDKLIQLMSSFFENGIKIKDLNVYLNESVVSGFINVNAADYSHASMPYEIGMIVGQNLSSELDIKLSKALLTDLKIPVEFVGPVLTEQYQFKEDDKEYTAIVKLEKNRLSVNGKIFQ